MRFILIILQLILLFAGYSVFLNQWISPKAFPFFNLIPLVYPFIFGANLVIICIWWLYRWKLGFIFTLLSIGLLFPINRTLHLFGSAETTESNLKVLSYNVHYFYDDPGGIRDLLEEEKPDVILIQEVGPGHDHMLDHLEYPEKIYYESFGGLVTASTYPIIESKRYRIPPNYTTLAYADIALPTDTVRFINFYMESLGIDQDKVKGAEVSSELQFLAKDVIQKMINGSKIHQHHLDSLLPKLTDTNYPIIVGGDMNSVPNTYEYYTLHNGRKDPFLKGGKGLGTTFPGFGYPLRLDYIFIPKEFKTKSYRSERVPHSDHYPVILEVEIP